MGAAVVGIIAISVYKLTKKSIGNDKLLWAVYLGLVVTTVVLQSELVSLVLAAAIGAITGAVIVIAQRSITNTDDAACGSDGGSAVELQEAEGTRHRVGRSPYRPGALSDVCLASRTLKDLNKTSGL